VRAICLTLFCSVALVTPAVAQPVRNIAIITPYMPNQPDATTKSAKGGAALMFGPAGAAGLRVLRTRRSDNFGDIMVNQGFSGPSVFLNDLVQDLTTEGYQVTIVPMARPDKAFVQAAPGVAAPTYLDVVVANYGYHQAPLENYKQAISLTYRTTDTASQKMLVSGSYEAKPNPQYQFSNQRDLNLSPGLAMAGLNDELAQAAAAIALAVK